MNPRFLAESYGALGGGVEIQQDIVSYEALGARV